MSSKYCPKCGRIVTVAGKSPPNYCAWGCGSLEHQPVLPEFKTWAEREKVIRDATIRNNQSKGVNEVSSPDDKTTPPIIEQLSLFG